MRILLCEDNVMMLKAMDHKLKNEGYEPDLAKDGKEALEKLNRNEYDLVITDLLMPFSTGLEIVHYIKKERKLQIPVIVLSIIGQEKTVLEAFDLGADEYIVKPFSPNELLIRIKKLFR
ncbi:MAG: response regulator transcription factor [Bacteroidales bacterium]|nr:response regulator transcription factor [Bacteroidales bacterium]